MASQWINLGAAKAYVATPSTKAGPGLLILSPNAASPDGMALADLYAEEGYVVLATTGSASAAEEAIRGRSEITGKVGAVGFGAGGKLALELAVNSAVDCAIVYYGEDVEWLFARAGTNGIPVMFHFPDADAKYFANLRGRFPEVESFFYRGIAAGFAEKGKAFDKSSYNLAYTRTMEMLRRTLGPRFDLDKVWDRHTELEFAERAAEQTMTTMVSSPNVNHVPVMTGGTGAEELLRFYKHHFIPTTPGDASLVPISRTIGADRAVDEMLFCFTHDSEIDWMLPGIKPTGKYVQIPLVAIVQFRGDKLVSEHIYWDQASVLVQIGLLDPKLYPTAGVETAKKAFDEHLPSNTLMARWKESGGRAGA